MASYASIVKKGLTQAQLEKVPSSKVVEVSQHRHRQDDDSKDVVVDGMKLTYLGLHIPNYEKLVGTKGAVYTDQHYKALCSEYSDDELFLVRIQEAYGVSPECAEAVWYLNTRTRGTEKRIRFIIDCSRDPKFQDFDWGSITRGDELEELERCGFKVKDVDSV
jgi:hypothetical protein